jgi:glyoxylase-like metal-dependent hydrolase (beta-lactamase superfamily II)
MEVQALAEGLWRWTARHPEWTADEWWDPAVGCVYYEAPEAVALIDPLVPADEQDHFWRALDRDVERLGYPVAVLVTCPWHERSAAAIEARYGATRELPKGVDAIAAASEEVAYWLPAPSTLVVGDVLVGTPSGLQLHPEWIEGGVDDAVGAALARFLELPIERVLVSHGSPVLEGGREALARAIGHAPSA